MWPSKKDEAQKPATTGEDKDAARKPWQDGLPNASPQKSDFFSAIRTDAYINNNALESYIEFWAAFKVDDANEKWRVMHYMVYDLDSADGRFISEPISVDRDTKKARDVDFVEAVAQLGIVEFMSATATGTRIENFEEDYPADRFPELKTHYHDLEHYKAAANIEGIAFNQFNEPYRKVDGKIFGDATFQRSEVVNSILAAEQAQDNERVKARIEGGILADIYTTAAAKTTTFDDTLKAGLVLASMDPFAVQVAALYLAVQKELGLNDGLKNITGLTDDEKKSIQRKAEAICGRDANAFGVIFDKILPDMDETLEKAEEEGVYVAPFRKMAAECGLYVNLLHASQNLKKLRENMLDPATDSSSLIDGIRAAEQRAREKFLQLGGSPAQVDKLQAWAADTSKNPVPAWLPGFVSRYYTARGNVMKKVQERQLGAQQTRLLPAAVKPPVTDEHNEQELKVQRVVKKKAPKKQA